MTLVLFFTRSMSLDKWIKSGLFEREKLIYEAHLLNGNLKKVYWLTYGTNDSIIAKKLIKNGKLHHSIVVCSMPNLFKITLIGPFIYSLFLPLVHHKVIRESQYLKTNQIDGSWSAVFAKWIFKKKLIVRTGYTQSIFLKNANDLNIKVFLSTIIELFAYYFCDIAIVSSVSDKNYISDKYGLDTKKIKIIPNFIDIEKFKPELDRNFKKHTLIFVGRLSKQKNIFNLIDAASNANVDLDIFGDGELREELKVYARSKTIKVNFRGILSNDELPKILNQYQYFVLPSLYEGMPKALIEAMACGLVCIGANVEGINELIEDNVCGFLANGTDFNSIYFAINRALTSNKIKLDLISQNAQKLIHKKHSLSTIVSSEMEIFNA